MRRTTPLLALIGLVLAACDGAKGDTGALTGGQTCTALATGTWTMTGPAWGMGDNPMDGELTMDAERCTFTLGAWDMVMDDLPTGGAVDGDQVRLDGLTSYWRSCVGTASDTDNVSGVCSDDDAAFEMSTGGS